MGYALLGSISEGFFKYVTPERIDVLQNGLIRFTPPTDPACNDYAECLPLIHGAAAEEFIRRKARDRAEQAFSKLTEQMRENGLSIEGPSFADWYEEFALDYYRRNGSTGINALPFRSQIGILSLTTDPLDQVMWAHYANNYKGFVIRFAALHFIGTGARPMWDLGYAWPVDYSRSRTYIDPSQVDGAAFAYEKDVKWAYEKEIRVVRLLAEATTIKNGTIHLFPDYVG